MWGRVFPVGETVQTKLCKLQEGCREQQAGRTGNTIGGVQWKMKMEGPLFKHMKNFKTSLHRSYTHEAGSAGGPVSVQ